MDEDELYLQRLSGGLFTLQLVDYVILDACSSAPASVKQRVLAILGQRRNATIQVGFLLLNNLQTRKFLYLYFFSQTIRNVVREYAANVGDTQASGGESETASDQEKSYMLHLADKF